MPVSLSVGRLFKGSKGRELEEIDIKLAGFPMTAGGIEMSRSAPVEGIAVRELCRTWLEVGRKHCTKMAIRWL